MLVFQCVFICHACSCVVLLLCHRTIFSPGDLFYRGVTCSPNLVWYPRFGFSRYRHDTLKPITQGPGSRRGQVSGPTATPVTCTAECISHMPSFAGIQPRERAVPEGMPNSEPRSLCHLRPRETFIKTKTQQPFVTSSENWSSCN